MNQISHFPVPYPSELLFYTICRYNKMMDESYSATNLRLFDKVDIGFKLFYLRGFKEYSNLFTKSKEHILNEHTPYRYFAPFYNKEQLKLIERYYFDNDKNAKFPYLVSNYELKKNLWYCPICAKLELEVHGEQYISTFNCLPNLPFCIYHNCMLVPAVTEQNKWNSEYITIYDQNMPEIGYSPIELIPIMEKVSPLIKDLFSDVYIPFKYTLEDIPERMYTLLKMNGFIYESSDSLNHKKLKNELFECYNLYNPKVLNVMELEEENFNNLGMILSRQFKTRPLPIVYYLIIGLFCKTMKEFYEVKPYKFKTKLGNSKNAACRKTEQHRLDHYKRKDEELCKELVDALNKINNYETRPMITKKCILAHTEHFRHCNLENMPNSLAMIESMLDDPEKFKYEQMRKAALLLINKGESISYRKMKKYAGLGLSQDTVKKHWAKITEEFYENINKRSLPKRM